MKIYAQSALNIVKKSAHKEKRNYNDCGKEQKSDESYILGQINELFNQNLKY